MSHLVSRLVSAVCMVALGACAAEEELGTVDVNLVGQAPSGAVYVLRHAEIVVTSATGFPQIFRTDEHGDVQRISADTLPGEYTIQLQSGWQMMRRTDGGEEAVPAVLVSPNPDTFAVRADATTSVTLRFEIRGEPVPLESGAFDIGVGVSEHVDRSVGPAVELPTRSSWAGNYVVAQSVDLPVLARLRRIGYIGAAASQPRCRFAVYDQVGGEPGLVQAQVGPRWAATGREELALPEVILPPGRYWLTVLCDGQVALRAGGQDVRILYRDVPPGAELPSLFPQDYTAQIGAALNLYLVVETP